MTSADVVARDEDSIGQESMSGEIYGEEQLQPHSLKRSYSVKAVVSNAVKLRAEDVIGSKEDRYSFAEQVRREQSQLDLWEEFVKYGRGEPLTAEHLEKLLMKRAHQQRKMAYKASTVGMGLGAVFDNKPAHVRQDREFASRVVSMAFENGANPKGMDFQAFLDFQMMVGNNSMDFGSVALKMSDTVKKLEEELRRKRAEEGFSLPMNRSRSFKSRATRSGSFRALGNDSEMRRLSSESRLPSSESQGSMLAADSWGYPPQTCSIISPPAPGYLSDERKSGDISPFDRPCSSESLPSFRIPRMTEKDDLAPEASPGSAQTPSLEAPKKGSALMFLTGFYAGRLGSRSAPSKAVPAKDGAAGGGQPTASEGKTKDIFTRFMAFFV